MDFLFSIGQLFGKAAINLPYILGGGFLTSIIALLVIWFVFPTAIPIIGNILKPVSKLVGELFVKFTKALVSGFNDIFDDTRTILTCAVCLILVSGYYSYNYEKLLKEPTANFCKPVIDDLRKDFRFVKRRK